MKALVVLLAACGSARAPSGAPSNVAPLDAAIVDAGPDAMAVSDAIEEASRRYDAFDFEAARADAIALLPRAEELERVRLLRLIVSADCQLGNSDEARMYWGQLPSHDQEQMTRRCGRFGIMLP